MSERAVGTRRRAVLCGVALLAVLGPAACGDSESESPSASPGAASGPAEAKPAKIAYLPYTMADYQQAMVDGMKEKVGAGGGSVTVFNANFDPQTQQKQCQDAVQSGRYTAIVLGAVDPATGVPCVTAARSAEIPVITLEIPVGEDINAVEPTVDGNVKAIVTPPDTNAKGQADLTALACADRDPCEVISEVATPTDKLTNASVDRITQDLPKAKVVQKIVTGYDPAALAKALPDALARHPGTDVFVAAADFQALAAIPPLKSAGKLDSVKLIGNGGSRSGVAAVEDGSLFATLGTWPFQMGELAGTAAVEATNGEAISGPAGLDAFHIDEPLLITKDNVREFEPEWGAK